MLLWWASCPFYLVHVVFTGDNRTQVILQKYWLAFGHISVISVNHVILTDTTERHRERSLVGCSWDLCKRVKRERERKRERHTHTHRHIHTHTHLLTHTHTHTFAHTHIHTLSLSVLIYQVHVHLHGQKCTTIRQAATQGLYTKQSNLVPWVLSQWKTDAIISVIQW